MTIGETLLPEYDEEMKNTRKMLECVPEEKFGWKPHEKSMSLGQLAGHVAELPSFAAIMIGTDKLDLSPDMIPFVPTSKAELVGKFDKLAAEGREAIARATDDHLSKSWSLVYEGQTLVEGPRTKVLRGMAISHLIHHRGQLTVYLRLLNVAFPGMYGPSADEMAAFSS